MSTIFSDELSAKWYARSVPEQPLATEHCDEPNVCHRTNRALRKTAR
jgi:hypothetical protein